MYICMYEAISLQLGHIFKQLIFVRNAIFSVDINDPREIITLKYKIYPTKNKIHPPTFI